MKNFILILGLSLLLAGCGEDAPPTKSNSSYTPPAFNKNEPAVAAPVQPVAATPAASAQPAAATPTAPAQPAQTATAAAPAKNTQNTGRPSSQILNDASATLDYGTGATPLNVKKRQEDKIQSIQNQYNKGANKAINGN